MVRPVAGMGGMSGMMSRPFELMVAVRRSRRCPVKRISSSSPDPRTKSSWTAPDGVVFWVALRAARVASVGTPNMS